MKITITELLKKLQSTDSLSERMKILKKNKYNENNICEACKNAYKFEDLNMCVIVEWCKWDLNFPLFKSERQIQNSRDCANFCDDECIKYSKTIDEDNLEKCKDCKHFCKKE